MTPQRICSIGSSPNMCSILPKGRHLPEPVLAIVPGGECSGRLQRCRDAIPGVRIGHRARDRRREQLPIARTPLEQANAGVTCANSRQLNLGVQLLAVDPDHPVFFRDPDPLSVPGQDPPVRSGIYSPDNISYIAIVDGANDYGSPARGEFRRPQRAGHQRLPRCGDDGRPDRDPAARSDRGGCRRHVHDRGCYHDPARELVGVGSRHVADLGAGGVQRLVVGRTGTAAHRGRRTEREAGDHAVESAVGRPRSTPPPPPSPSRARTGPASGDRCSRRCPRTG